MNQAPRTWDLPFWLKELESRHKTEIHLGLKRIQDVANALHLTKPKAKVITVGGTNGKGSTVSALEHMYHQAGYKVGAYTSPHLMQFNERIRVNLQPISDANLCDAFTEIEQGRGNTLLTYFESATLAALWYFQRQQVDIIILEVGLGGRLDATNIIDSDLAIITTIDFDHQEFLGNTLEEIGYEKAGILRPQTPFIYADSNIPTSILKQAEIKTSIPYLFGKDYQFAQKDNEWSFIGVNTQINNIPIPKIQLKSAAAAIMAVLLLNRYLPVTEQVLKTAIKEIFVAGRLQVIQGPVTLVFDVAHNPQSARLLADKLIKLNTGGRIHAVFSALKDKDITGLVAPLKDCVAHWYPAQLDTKRAASEQFLLEQLQEAEIFADFCYTSPLVAFNAAVEQAEPGDVIVVFGSFYTVGQVMSLQQYPLKQKEVL